MYLIYFELRRSHRSSILPPIELLFNTFIIKYIFCFFFKRSDRPSQLFWEFIFSPHIRSVWSVPRSARGHVYTTQLICLSSQTIQSIWFRGNLKVLVIKKLHEIELFSCVSCVSCVLRFFLFPIFHDQQDTVLHGLSFSVWKS